jgi:carboxymethylenebutenolidase
MTQQATPFSSDQIGYGPVRFSSSGIFSTHKDHMVDPYAATRMPKEAQVEGVKFSPQASGLFPAMVVLHEKWGLTSPVLELAKRLACEGYVVLVPNLYGRQGGMITSNTEVADALQERLDDRQALQDIHACFEYLNANIAEDANLEQTTRNAHALIGFGMGATLAIKAAAHRRRLQAAVAIYPSLPQDSTIVEKLYCPLFLHIPGQNTTIAPSELDQFQQAAKQAGKTVNVRHYPEASDGFCNTLSPGFRSADCESVLQSSMEFISSILKKS